MKYYAHINNNGEIQGWYNEEIHNNIPNPNIEVSYEIWQEAISINANFYNKKTNKFENKDFRSKEQIEEDKKQEKKYQREEFLKQSDILVARHKEQIEIEANTTLSKEEYKTLLEYRQYLRDITLDKSFPNIDIKTLQEFML